MAKVTAEFTKVVWVKIKGESRKGTVKLPTLPDDGGLCKRFQAWTIENNIQSPIIGQSGGGCYAAAFWPEDMEKIEAWLEANQVDCCEIVNN